MPSISADRTRTLVERILRIVGKHPGITIHELASRLGIEDSSDLVIKLRAALQQVRDDPPPRNTDRRDDALSVAWGPPPSASDVAGARWFGLATERSALSTALEGALTRDQAAEQIGVTPQAISERLKSRKLVALRRGREWRFPAWQFADDGTVAGLPELIAAWPGAPLPLCVWAVTPSPDLDGRSPAEELSHRDGSRRVLELADAISAAGW
jgi:hypothetical protein